MKILAMFFAIGLAAIAVISVGLVGQQRAAQSLNSAALDVTHVAAISPVIVRHLENGTSAVMASKPFLHRNGYKGENRIAVGCYFLAKSLTPHWKAAAFSIDADGRIGLGYAGFRFDEAARDHMISLCKDAARAGAAS